jgi:hypothetical protein
MILKVMAKALTQNTPAYQEGIDALVSMPCIVLGMLVSPRDKIAGNSAPGMHVCAISLNHLTRCRLMQKIPFEALEIWP